MPTHWLKVRCDKGRTKIINSRHKDNPRYFDQITGEPTKLGRDYVIGVLSNKRGVMLDRYYKGIWSAAEGLVYDSYDPHVNVYKHLPTPPESWRRYLSIDFGYKNPFVCQWWAEDEDGRLYLYKELYMTNGLVEDHARTILENMGRQREPRPSYVICDHDAEGRATLEKYLGMSTIAAKKTVSDGVQAVAERMRIQGDGRPRLYLCRDSLIRRDPMLENEKKPCSTIEEIVGYVWDTKKDVPVKDNDHGMDAMRYMVAFKDLQPQMGFRTFTY
jgi:phage terminase large subunit